MKRKTRYDCKYYYMLHCSEPTKVRLFNMGVSPRCHLGVNDDLSKCVFMVLK